MPQNPAARLRHRFTAGWTCAGTMDIPPVPFWIVLQMGELLARPGAKIDLVQSRLDQNRQIKLRGERFCSFDATQPRAGFKAIDRLVRQRLRKLRGLLTSNTGEVNRVV